MQRGQALWRRPKQSVVAEWIPPAKSPTAANNRQPSAAIASRQIRATQTNKPAPQNTSESPTKIPTRSNRATFESSEFLAQIPRQSSRHSLASHAPSPTLSAPAPPSPPHTTPSKQET